MTEREPGRLVAGRYRTSRLLGRGSMSEVWLARDERLERDVALKFLAGGVTPTADFEREIGILSGLRHPNIVTVYDAGEEGGERYIVMERVDGSSLRDRLQAHGPLQSGEAASIGAKVSGALAYAHQHGVLHNDVKPENILLSAGGEPRLTDFGAATITGATLDTAGASQLMGTIAYVAPEVLHGTAPTPASDIYSLATALFEAIAGRLPFDGPSNAALAGQKLSQLPARLSTVVPGTPEALDSLLGEALSASPAERPTATRLERALSGMMVVPEASGRPMAVATVPRRVTEPVRPAVPERSSRTGVLLLGAVAGAGLIIAGAMAWGSGRDPGPEETGDGAQLNAAVGSPTAAPTATPTPTSAPPPTQEAERPAGGNRDEDDRDEDDDRDEREEREDRDNDDDDRGRGRGNPGRGRGR